jgi:hypothetical protein
MVLKGSILRDFPREEYIGAWRPRFSAYSGSGLDRDFRPMNLSSNHHHSVGQIVRFFAFLLCGSLSSEQCKIAHASLLLPLIICIPMNFRQLRVQVLSQG